MIFGHPPLFSRPPWPSFLLALSLATNHTRHSSAPLLPPTAMKRSLATETHSPTNRAARSGEGLPSSGDIARTGLPSSGDLTPHHLSSWQAGFPDGSGKQQLNERVANKVINPMYERYPHMQFLNPDEKVVGNIVRNDAKSDIQSSTCRTQKHLADAITLAHGLTC